MLFAEKNSEEIVAEAFDVVNRAADKKVHEYRYEQVFQMWKESTRNPTYGSLRSALDEYSVFCGRNPLVSVLCVCLCTRIFTVCAHAFSCAFLWIHMHECLV